MNSLTNTQNTQNTQNNAQNIQNTVSIQNGVSTIGQDVRTIIPICADNLNGKYVCTYTTTNSGVRSLRIFLLNQSNSPGGDGLNGFYFNDYDSATDISLKNISVYQNIDSQIYFTWPTGGLIPNIDTNIGQINSVFLPLKNTGQSVLWGGYLISPKTDKFSIFTRVENMNVTIYLDNNLLYDTIDSIQNYVNLKINTAYQIKVIAKTNAISSTSVSVSLMWLSSSTKMANIPKFFLYSGATEINLSPFLVDVK